MPVETLRPNANGDLMVELIAVEWDNSFMRGERWIVPGYSYWGGVGQMISLSDTPKGEYSDNFIRDLTLDTMSPRRLIMSGTIFFESNYIWQYNHGRRGWAYAFEWLNTPLDTIARQHERYEGEQDATGRSQLFGDGRAEWRPIPLKLEDNLPSNQDVGLREEEWNGPGSGYIVHADAMYY